MDAQLSPCAIIPHSGSMCLLHQVVQWDSESIRCTAISHRDPDNPLRSADRLASVHAVEYACQACALHGALTAAEPAAAARSLLAAIGDVDLAVSDLAALPDSLEVFARRELGTSSGAIYRFEVASGGRAVASGRLTVLAALGEGR